MTDIPLGSHDSAFRDDVLGAKSKMLLASPSESEKILGSDQIALCDKCTVLDYRHMKSRNGQVHHDNWTRLKESASHGCPLCTFFTLAPLHPKSSSRATFYADSSGPLHFKIPPFSKQKTTCLYVCVPQDKRTAAIYYLYLTTDNHATIPQCDITMNDSEQDRFSPIAIQKITSWIETCKAEHVFCRKQTQLVLPTRVIDIDPPGMPGCIRLVEGEARVDAEYLALSHCWGNMPFNRFDLLSKCETINIDSLRNGIQPTLLPKLYQDAIELTKALNKKYIWIDSLCIIQDSKEDWASECQRMSSIYSNCYLTISALSYENNAHSFRHILPSETPPHHRLCALTNHPNSTIHVRSMVEHRSRKDYLKHRGWAFQELLLSPRVLHFTTTAMAFECDTSTILERGPASDVLYGIDTDRKRFVFSASDTSQHNAPTAYHDRWLHLVQSYSHLDLTFKTDRLPALSGISAHVASKTDDKYVAGLWRGDIAAGLLWYVWPCQPAAQGQTYVAPSWSWASAASVWMLDPARRGFVSLVVEDVKSTLASSNPFGEVCAGKLRVSGPLKRCATRDLVKKGHRYFIPKGKEGAAVRFALDTGRAGDLNAASFWCLDCTKDKDLDVGLAQASPRRETFFRPHGLVLVCIDEGKQVYKRMGVFEVYSIAYEETDWHRTGFQTGTITVI